MISYFSKSTFVKSKVIYYDLDGELRKELVVKNVKEMDKENNKYRPTHLVMTNKQNDRKSVFRVDQIIFSPEIEDEYFTTRYLERQ